MTYDICVFEPSYADSLESARAAWNEEKYWETSLPDYDRSARKWRVKDVLLSADNRMHFDEPEAPKTGFFAKLLGKPQLPGRALDVCVVYGDVDTTYQLLDQAIEITLPWSAVRGADETCVRDMWGVLKRLAAAGWSTIYDGDRDALINLETDFEAVLARYRKNLADNEADEEPAPQGASQASPSANAPQSATGAAKPASLAAAKSDKPFTGNVD